MHTSPKVSVLMPVYNGAKYLREAVDSILGQTFGDFEFIVIDDGSTDDSVQIVESYDDPRIRFLRNPTNEGLIATLNKGLNLAAGQYIARMDCDDVSLPERLARQVAFMESRPELAASGTWARDIDSGGKVIGERHTPPVGARMEYDFWYPSPLIHPTAIIRAACLGEMRYDPQALHAEDYDLWLRLRKRYRLDNLPEELLLYRVHGESVTQKHMGTQLSSASKALSRYTGLSISVEAFLELVGLSRKLNPARRALLRWRLARAIGQPYRNFRGEDIEYGKEWLRARLTADAVRSQLLRVPRYLRRRLGSRAADDSLKPRGSD